MEKWSAGQIELFDVLARICDGVSSGNAAELARSITSNPTPDFSNELRTLRARAAQVDHLQKDNDQLRAELEDTLRNLESRRLSPAHVGPAQSRLRTPVLPYGSSAKGTPEPNIALSFSSDTSSDDPRYTLIRSSDFPSAEGDFAQLVRKYNQIITSYKNMSEARKILEDGLRKKRSDEQRWIAYSRALERRLQKQGNAMLLHGITPSVENGLRGIPNLELDAGVRQPHPSSGSTQEEPEERREASNDGTSISVVIKEEEPEESPVVISSRSIRKRAAQATLSPTNSHVKLEDPGSSPVLSATRVLHETHESVDLDEVGERITTPKKRRLKEAHARKRQKTIPISNDTTPQVGLNSSTSRHVASKPSRKFMALQPRSPNKPVFPRTSESLKPQKIQVLENRIEGARIFSEDSTESSYFHENQGVNIQTPAPFGISGRLGSLLDTPTPINPQLSRGERLLYRPTNLGHCITPLKHQPKAATQATPTNLDTRSSRSTPIAGGLNTSPRLFNGKSTILVNNEVNTPNVPRPEKRSNILAPPASVARRGLKSKDELIALEADDPIHEPFRARPLRRLGLEHFKINPNYSPGYDFAFNDVVRGREARKCLPGCTKPDCCGNKFRKVAEFMQDARSNQAPTLSQEEADQRLLNEYMGNNRSKLLGMCKAEKEELLMEAKARDLARQHGKHRQTYERRQSPPGFWRADFPTTQEEAADKVAAERQEREIVKTRFEEAMRGDGAWVFRDE